MHPMTRRIWLAAALAAIPPMQAMAQPGGGKTTTLVVPFAAAGPTDFMARLLAQPLGRELGTQVIIDNRPGASGNIGTKQVMAARPDGLTLVHTTVAMQAINPLMYPDQNFHPERDLVPVGITGALPNVLVVHPSAGIKTLAELVAKGQQKNARLNFATFGPGSSPHFYGTLFQKLTQVVAEPIAYKGSGDAAKDMLAGRIDYMFDSMTTALPNAKADKLVALAITSPERSALLPDVPTLKELGYGAANLDFWLTLQVPAKTPPEIVQALRQAVSKAVQDPQYQKNVAARGVVNLYVAPDQLDAFFTSETAKWRDTALSIGIKAE
ncbi:tripartite tricarboxylate transporter substrate binding protein [Comamonas faecalis]|uniref:Tripartite tricarboxylate transporter substrate binding protein n=1 Tax=Comamonas faecalis TaxID=1387849 RepID=A0ABP7QYQ1_9BURK